MIRDLLLQAQRGQALWISDVRKQMTAEEHDDVIIQLRTGDGCIREFVWPVSRWEKAEERSFVLEYLAAAVFNTLSCFGGEQLCLFYPADSVDYPSLFSELRDLFQLDKTRRNGYGKVIQIADRLCRAEGKGHFRLPWDGMEQYRPAKAIDMPGNVGLKERLRTLTQTVESGLYCGIDVGGTDIKATVAFEGKLLATKEYDWNPASYRTAEEITGPIFLLARLLRLAVEYGDRDEFQRALEKAASLAFMRETVEQLERECRTSMPLYDGIGLSFPDVVMEDRILGGETPKTRGMRDNTVLPYETEFAKIGRLGKQLETLCKPDTRVRIANDGNVAAFTTAVEMTCQGVNVESGVFAHSLGTDLGTGWLPETGSFPPFPLEMYDFLIDLGSYPQRSFGPEDVRSVRNENSGLPDARKYLGQSAAFRLAYEKKPELLTGFLEEDEGLLRIRTGPEDRRKECLEHLMKKAEEGDAKACAVFYEIGYNLGQISREIAFLLHPDTNQRYLYGRFVKHPICFQLIRQGCRDSMPELELLPADDTLACSPLMLQLAARADVSVAQFGQAVGALYLGALQEDREHETK